MKPWCSYKLGSYKKIKSVVAECWKSGDDISHQDSREVAKLNLLVASSIEILLPHPFIHLWENSMIVNAKARRFWTLLKRRATWTGGQGRTSSPSRLLVAYTYNHNRGNGWTDQYVITRTSTLSNLSFLARASFLFPRSILFPRSFLLP